MKAAVLLLLTPVSGLALRLPREDAYYMRIALDEAAAACDAREVPIGAAVRSRLSPRK